jgi:hypothetical protein
MRSHRGWRSPREAPLSTRVDSAVDPFGTNVLGFAWGFPPVVAAIILVDLPGNG